MGKLIIDVHSHLWLRQDTQWNGLVIRTKDGNGSRSAFLGEERQMLPPFMIDGRNTAEVFLSNMDYAQVGAAVVVQEFIDGIHIDAPGFEWIAVVNLASVMAKLSKKQ